MLEERSRQQFKVGDSFIFSFVLLISFAMPFCYILCQILFYFISCTTYMWNIDAIFYREIPHLEQLLNGWAQALVDV
jgi:hypothetical protein